MSHQTSTNNYQNSRYIVGTGIDAYPTIQSAINEANASGGNSVVFVRPGSYTENLTLYTTVHLEGAENSVTTIIGKHTPPNTGSVNFTRITFASTTHVLDSNAAGTTSLTFNRCRFNTDNGFACNLPNWTGGIYIKYCTDISTKNGIINNTGASPVVISYSMIGTSTVAMAINGVTEIFSSKIGCPITLSGSVSSVFEGGSSFSGVITTAGSAVLIISNSRIATGSATAITLGSSGLLYLNNIVLNTSHATAIGGTGSVQFSEVTFVDSKGLAGTVTEVLTGVVKTGEIYADTITRMEMTGFYAFSGAAPYFDDTTLGSFTLLAAAAGTGYIKGKKVTWAGTQTVSGMTSGSTWWIYIDSTGTIGKTNSRTDALFVDYIVLFECLYDETTGTKLQYTVKENHNYNFPVGASNYLHDVIGAVIENANNGANIIAGTTGVRISISGNDVLTDHGLDTTISAAADVTWNKMYTTAGGKWARDGAASTDFAGRWNNAGTPTALSTGRFAVYTLYVGKDSLNSTDPTYWAVLNTADYGSSAAAATAIANGVTSKATNELASLELAQLGFITFRQSTGVISVITISKSTLRSTLSSGGTNQASLIVADTTNFNNLLSASDSNVQAALDTLDDIFINTAAATTSPQVLFKKYRGAAALTSGDLTGTIKFGGYDGTQVTDSARITSTSSGTIASTRVAGNLQFYTHPDSSAADPTLRMTIASTGAVTIASPDSGVGLTVSNGGITATVGNIAASSGTLSASTTVTAGTNLVSTAGNLLLPTTSSTVGQIQINSVTLFHAYGTNNLFIGPNSGNFTAISDRNVGLGNNSLLLLTSGSGNLAIGSDSIRGFGGSGVSGSYNVAVGTASLYGAESANRNIAIGSSCMYKATSAFRNQIVGLSAAYNLTSGSYNIGLGFATLYNLTTGVNNIAIGNMDLGTDNVGAGSAHTLADSNNIDISNVGVAGESNKIRIGTQGTGVGQQNACYIAGIYNTAVGATAGVVLSDSAHKLGGLAGAANTIFVGGTAPSFTASPTVSGTITGNAISSTTTVTAGTNLVSTAGNLLLPATTATVGQIKFNNYTWAHSGANVTGEARNVFIGYGTGATAFTASELEGIVFIGYHSGYSLSHTGGGRNGFYNLGIGSENQRLVSTGYFNTSMGDSCLWSLTTGKSNTAIGAGSLAHIITGSHNVGIGCARVTSGIDNYAGKSYTSSESSNIVIQNIGVIGESNKIRIGTQGSGDGQQDACYIAGIYNTSVGATAGVVLSDSDSKLGGLAGAAGTVLMGGTKPAFSTATYPATVAKGDVLVASATNVVDIVTGAATAGYVLTANGAGSAPTFQVIPGLVGMTWSEVTADTALAASNGYITNKAGTRCECILPATAAVGEVFAITGKGATGWQITQNANQIIYFASSNTTTGVGGSLSSSGTYDCIELVCITADLYFVVKSVVGNITVV